MNRKRDWGIKATILGAGALIAIAAFSHLSGCDDSPVFLVPCDAGGKDYCPEEYMDVIPSPPDCGSDAGAEDPMDSGA